jgi:hypothetical protein
MWKHEVEEIEGWPMEVSVDDFKKQFHEKYDNAIRDIAALYENTDTDLWEQIDSYIENNLLSKPGEAEPEVTKKPTLEEEVEYATNLSIKMHKELGEEWDKLLELGYDKKGAITILTSSYGNVFITFLKKAYREPLMILMKLFANTQ